MPNDTETAVQLAEIRKDIEYLRSDIKALKEPVVSQKNTVSAFAVIGTLIGAMSAGAVAVWRILEGNK